jgi:ATP-dependent DNA helicase RecG
VPIATALLNVHFPNDQESLEAARRRLIYDEFFLLELALAVNRNRLAHGGRAPKLATTPRIDARIRRLLPFALTPGQERAIADVVRDLAGDTPMNRLLQGDVGSGKTAVAVYALLVAVAHGYQAVLMAPTEVLARQHSATLEGYLAHSRVRRLLLTGGSAAARRRETLSAIRAGQFDLVVGTHAVIQDDVEFARLGLVVIDEQHKFGVRQRGRFRGATETPHTLVMTATPIPRTLSMTLFGDFDLSTIADLPPGRQKVNTYVVIPETRARVWEFVRRKLREGRQAYVICPLIEGSESLDLRSAETTFEELSRGELAGFSLDLLHGRMDDLGKQAAMDAFRARRTQVLVSTTVVEVGIDVPSATLMVVEHAERFGLSQLHQLRGRVSRGAHAGYCFLMDHTGNEQARKRLDVLAETTDGFRIAEADFELRGPGEVLGTRQHGLPDLRLGDLRRDRPLLEEARRDAFALVERDPGLRDARFALLRRELTEHYGDVLDLAEVG